MAITSLDQLVAGLRPPEDFARYSATASEAAGVYKMLGYEPGLPGAMATPAPGVNGAILTTYAGQIPFSNPSSGNAYVARLEVSASSVGRLVVADRIWHNSGLNVATTTEQTITFPSLPARDNAGTTAGVGLQCAIEVSTITGNGAQTSPTIRYTNSAGTPNRTGTIVFPATAQVGTFAHMRLQAGDVGIRSIEGVTLGTSLVSGAIHLVLYRPICTAIVNTASAGSTQDALALGMPVCHANTVPMLLWLPSTTSAVHVHGSITFAHG